jgi:hypothetical protein
MNLPLFLNLKKLWMLCCCILLNVTLSIATTSSEMWTNASLSEFNLSNERTVFPLKFQALHLTINDMRNVLATAPKEIIGSRIQGLELALPFPDGSFKRFSVLETEVMHPLLQAKYPLLKTYVAQGIDDINSWARIDIGYLGFHAMIATPEGWVFIDPVNNTELENYICYNKSDMPQAFDRHCEFEGDKQREESIALEIAKNKAAKPLKLHDTGDELRTYRLAMACTGEYAATKGGTVPGALSGIVTSVNRVNGIYENEVAVRMILIANTDTLIFLNSSSDPYSNNNGGAMLAQNQTTITARIGSTNYDFGHVFSTGGGGIAGLGVICDNSQKANGVTGLPNPVGDAFDVDYVSHEMGHQFSGNHSFNSNSQGSCSGNASMGHNFEPGSGTTIMGYAGICFSHDIQPHSDALFHVGSYEEIFNYTIFAFGNSCAATTNTGNSAPVINPVTDYTIPFKTPFMLTGSASDPDGDPLTYIWEEYDSGPFGAPSNPTFNAAIFRDFTPSTDSTRTFPKLTSIINNTSVLGELLPTYARVLHFKFTARDNRIGGGGVSNSFTPAAITVINTTNPFKVNSPNTGTELWNYGSTAQVTWDVSSTDLAPINCSNVALLLSVDGGFTFPHVLLASTPNDGSETIVVPSLGSGTFSQARVKVQSVGNIFFDMSNVNFTIGPTGVVADELIDSAVNLFPNPTTATSTLELTSNYSGTITIRLVDYTGRILSTKIITKESKQVQIDLQISDLSRGVYFVELQSENNKVVKRLIKY